MIRYVIPFGGLLALGACASTSTPTLVQSVYALEQGYTVTAKAETIVMPHVSAADQANIRHLDEQAYLEVVKLRVAAQTGVATSVEIQAASDAMLALTNALSKAGV